MTNQYVPTEPTGCFLDYTYCSSEHCQNKCGRKMSEEIKSKIELMPFARIAFSDFCKDKR